MLSPEQVSSFVNRGYIVLPNHVPPPQIEGLAEVCDRLLDEEAPANGAGKFHALGRGETLRFLRQRFQQFAQIREILFSKDMVDAARALLGSKTCYMFNEQYVVKDAGTQSQGNNAFAWHQDGSYVGFDHRPYLTMWLAIDRATPDNGALRVLPRNLAEDVSLGEYRVDPATNERVCYDGDDHGILVTAEPGTLVVFSSTTMHCSTPNQTSQSRRAWLCQFSAEPIIDPATGQPKHFAISA